jgi:hypothetical protein
VSARIAVLTGILLLPAVQGCGAPALDAGRARDVVLGHVRAVAPRAVVADSFDVLVDHVGAPAEGARPVRFRTIWVFADTSGLYVDTSQVFTARVSRDTQGWHVSDYDGPFLAHLATVVDEDLRRMYEDLLDALHHVYHAMTEDGWYYNEGGIPVDEVRRSVAAHQGEHLDHMGYTWGLTPQAGARIAQIVWLRDASGAICALPMTAGTMQPEGFEWVRDREWFTCRGRSGSVYSRATLFDSLTATVARDGVLPPAAPPR